MRILFATHSLPPPGSFLANVGGMQRVAAELHLALSEHPGVSLTTVAASSSARWYGTTTYLFLGRLLARLPAYARRARPDVVLLSSMTAGVVAPGFRRRMPDVRLAAIAHGRDVTLPTRLNQRLLPPAFAALDAVLPVSSATAAACQARGADPSRLHVVPNGVDLARFKALPERHAARALLADRAPLPDDAFVLVAAGRQVRRKGTAWFIRGVLPLLPPVTQLWVIGEGPEDEAIRAAISEVDAGDRVRVFGRVTEGELMILLRGGDLFVMPNVPVVGDMEGFGVVMLEAGLCGLPVVASALEGITDVVVEGESGHLVPPLDAGAFADVIGRYVRDRAALQGLACRARAHVARAFAWPVAAERYVATLERVIAGEGGRLRP
jgi:phosphatidylinositol alpha-1,6-mannosyltransferase